MPPLIVSTKTFNQVFVPKEAIDISEDEFRKLPWIKSRVGSLQLWNAHGAVVQIHGYAGDLKIGDRCVIRVTELVLGTVATCLPLSTGGRRQASQSSSSGRAIRPATQVALEYTYHLADYLREGSSLKQYQARHDLLSRPKGKILARESLLARRFGRVNGKLACEYRRLTANTAINRYLISAAVRAEGILRSMPGEPRRSASANLYLLGGVSILERPSPPRGPYNRPSTGALIALARTLIEGVPSLPSNIRAEVAYSGWINLDRIFEQAVRRVLEEESAAFGIQVEANSRPLFMPLEDGGESPKRAVPDFVFQASGRRLIGDAKYRRTGENPSEDQLYQLIAHAVAFEADIAALVVPALSLPPSIRHLGRISTGCHIAVVSVDASDAARFRGILRSWLTDALDRLTAISPASSSA